MLFTEISMTVTIKQILDKQRHLDVLWRFMAGLTGFRDIGWELVCKAIQRASLFSSCLLVQSLFEIHSEQEIRTACDTIHKKQYQRIVSLNSTDQQNYPLRTVAGTPFDCYAVGYCVAVSGHEWSLSASNIGGNEIVEMLSCGLRSVGDVWGYFYTLNLSRNSLTHQAIIYLSEFPSKILNQISVLDLSYNKLNKDAFNCLAVTVEHMVNLTRLDISNNPGGHGGMVKVFQKLLTTKVHTLNVFKANLGSSDIQALSQLIRPAASLKAVSYTHLTLPTNREV